MTSKPTRAQFIDKLRGLEMTVETSTHPFEDGEPDESRGVLHWFVSGEIYVIDDDKEEGDAEVALWGQPGLGLSDLRRSNEGVSRLRVFHMKGMTVQLSQVRDAWDALDARDADSSHFMPLIDGDTGYIRDDLSADDDDVEGASSLVIIDRARIADGWRGQGGIGRLLIEQAISLVTEPAGLSLVALEAHPYLDETEDQDASPEAVAATERTWASMGFTRVDEGKLFIRSTAKENLFDEVAHRLDLV